MTSDQPVAVSVSERTEPAQPAVADPIAARAEAPVPAPEIAEPIAGGVRSVRFALMPAGAELRLDGAITPWFGVTHELTVGAHVAEAHVQGPCCLPAKMAFTVEPAAEQDPPQLVILPLTVKPAGFVLSGAPTGASVSCADATSSGGAVSFVQLGHRVTWTGSCRFSSGVLAQQTLRAGEVTAIPWP